MQMRILVAYDDSISADAAIEDLPRAGVPQQAEALVLCVAHEESHAQMTLSEAKDIAANAGDRIKSYFPQWSVSSDALVGSPARVLAEATDLWHADLLVIGSHGRSGVRRLFLGSVSWELIHSAACPVRVARVSGSTSAGESIRIVVGID